MLSVASNLLTTLQGMLSPAGPEPFDRVDPLENIRQHMLDGLGEEGCLRFPQIERRVLFAPDVESLWYLRPELLMAVAFLRGEGMAQRLLGQISLQFEGLLPAGLTVRRVGPAR